MTRMASLLLGLFANLKAAGLVTGGDALRLSNFELFATTDPVQSAVQQTYGCVTDGLICVTAPADWAALDDVGEVIAVIFDPACLITEQSEDFGNGEACKRVKDIIDSILL